MIYQVQISLMSFKPKIWRRILIPSDMLLSDFHKVIQTTMGWVNGHLHQFVKNRTFYAEVFEDDDFGMNIVDYKGMKVSDLLKKEKEKIIYEYDFGDGWEHIILLEKVLPVDPKMQYPICLTGKMNCPPEDCGGVWGYANMLEILTQPKHPEYKSYMEWLGEGFDPKYFDKNEINELLAEDNYGCIEF